CVGNQLRNLSYWNAMPFALHLRGRRNPNSETSSSGRMRRCSFAGGLNSFGFGIQETQGQSSGLSSSTEALFVPQPFEVAVPWKREAISWLHVLLGVLLSRYRIVQSTIRELECFAQSSLERLPSQS